MRPRCAREPADCPRGRHGVLAGRRWSVGTAGKASHGRPLLPYVMRLSHVHSRAKVLSAIGHLPRWRGHGLASHRRRRRRRRGGRARWRRVCWRCAMHRRVAGRCAMHGRVVMRGGVGLGSAVDSGWCAKRRRTEEGGPQRRAVPIGLHAGACGGPCKRWRAPAKSGAAKSRLSCSRDTRPAPRTRLH